MQDSYELEMQIRSDENGFFDRECPNEECLFTFKIDLKDWEEKVTDEHVYCPRCGCDAPSDKWWTQEQLEALNKNVSSFALGLVHDELKTIFRDIERKSRHNKYARITYKPGRRPQYANLPITQSEEWATEIVCDCCGVRFSVIGNAYFCPCCGKDLTTNAIRESLASYHRRIDGYERLQSFYESEFGKEEAAKQMALSREDTLDSLVGTFESFAKNRFLELGGQPQRGNVFQRVVDGSNLFKNLTGKEYRDFIGDDGVAMMIILVNRRHLISHNNGIVDDAYIRKTSDTTYEVGQRIIVKDRDLLTLLGYIEKVVTGLLEANIDTATA